eukprot:4536624-Prymnesium_polylepis.1
MRSRSGTRWCPGSWRTPAASRLCRALSHDASGAAPRLRAPSTAPSTAARASAPSRPTRTTRNASPPW